MSYIYFVSPVGSDPEYIAKRSLLKDLEKETGVAFFFPLEHNSSFSLDTARNDIRYASMVIADLSLERPSCYFEVGVAQALGARVILVAATGTTLHQAGSTESALMYSNLDEYRDAIQYAILCGGLRLNGT